MSSHPKRRDREPLDSYQTPELCAGALASLLQIRPGQLVLEPSAGDGNFVYAIYTAHGVKPVALELDNDRFKMLQDAPCEDRLRGRFEDFFPTERYDWIVGNPPYSLAVDHVQQGLFLLKEGGRLAFLLRAGFAHTAGRNEFIRRFPPWREYALVERPPFDGEGNDSSEYVFYVWQRGYQGRTVREYVSWKNDEWARRDIAHVRELDWLPLAA